MGYLWLSRLVFNHFFSCLMFVCPKLNNEIMNYSQQDSAPCGGKKTRRVVFQTEILTIFIHIFFAFMYSPYGIWFRPFYCLTDQSCRL